LLADASDEEWATLLEHTRYRRFGPGDAVLTAGERDQPLYLVLEGQLEVLADHGRRIASVGADNVIGELSCFDGGARSGLVRAVTPAMLAELSPTEFDALAASSPDLARRLLFDLGRILAHRLRAASRPRRLPGQPMSGAPIIEIREPGRQVRRVAVDRAIEVGRECDGEVLSDEGVSRRHLRLVPSPVALAGRWRSEATSAARPRSSRAASSAPSGGCGAYAGSR
jgi:CRP/FNR family transcriptional regulator, cyclic AMP receptor protein